METQEHIMAYFPLFEYMSEEHGLTLLESELQEIIRLSDIVKARYNKASGINTSSNTKIDEWMVHGSVGISSKTMWAALKGLDIDPKYGDKPYDPCDFGRCYELVKYCNITKEDLQVISNTLPYWKPYIDYWDKLCEMYEANEANNWNTSKEIGMFNYMQNLRIMSDAIKFSKQK